jgi:hypothetical protein
MHYKNIYEKLINRARNRISEIYTESHHIIPRCMNGDNSRENLVELTPEEHHTAHLLLVKIYPDHIGLVKAAVMMSLNLNGNRPKNKLYGWLRRKHSETTSGKNNVNFGRPRAEEVKDKISASNKGKSRGKGVKKGPMKEETKKKLSESLKGKPAPHMIGDKNPMKNARIAEKVAYANSTRKHDRCSEETKIKISSANKGHRGLSGNDNPGSWRCCCIRCGKETTMPALTKWHKNCKLI